MNESITIQGRRIGPGAPVYVVAEISANHRGSRDVALALVEAAAGAGADAVKLQTYTADTITLASDAPCFRLDHGTLWDGRTLHDLYDEAHTPWAWHPRLFERARELGLHAFSSPFDPSAVDFLEALGAPAHKIASFEIVDIPLLRAVAATGKPVIMSTGMATAEEVAEAVAALRDAGCRELALLRCTSAYPAPPETMHLRAIPALARAHGVVAGLSDHSLGIAAAVASVALGARIIEKHVTLRRADGGPDAAFSLEPAELRALVEAVRVAEAALGEAHPPLSPAELRARDLRRSLFAVADIAAGEPFTDENVRSIRPAAGLHPRHLPDLLGRRAARDIPRGTPLAWELVAR